MKCVYRALYRPMYENEQRNFLPGKIRKKERQFHFVPGRQKPTTLLAVALAVLLLCHTNGFQKYRSNKKCLSHESKKLLNRDWEIQNSLFHTKMTKKCLYFVESGSYWFILIHLVAGDYLVESGADQVVVYRWYHRLFHVVAKNRYLPGLDGQRIHENLAHYFLGR